MPCPLIAWWHKESRQWNLWYWPNFAGMHRLGLERRWRILILGYLSLNPFLWNISVIKDHWFRYWLGAGYPTIHFLNQWYLHCRICSWMLYHCVFLNCMSLKYASSSLLVCIASGAFLLTWLNLISEWIINYMHFLKLQRCHRWSLGMD